ncbi:MAG: UTP--glucose-1-phosphate uridylyltransferase [Chloroflexi bacterium]|nr:UTP--glucose-1-phosphate uridylyltransferase [Chloroflexota bacterium]
MPKVRKAVILAAGLGTRMLPATRAVPKEMLPIVDKPLIQYAVEECVSSGIEEIVFVVADGKEAIRDHFGASSRAEAWARDRNDTALLAVLQAPSKLARFHFAHQDQPRGIAHAVACARQYVEGEPFALLFPDDLILGSNPVIGQLAAIHEARGGTVIAVMDVPREETPQYGIVDAPAGANPAPVRGLVEKPALGEAPSTLAIVGRYILSAGIFAQIDRLEPGRNGELQITDAIAGQLAAGEPVWACAYEGDRYDTGRPAGYLIASVAAGLARPDVAPAIVPHLRQLLESRTP